MSDLPLNIFVGLGTTAGVGDPLHLIVEIKGYRREQAKAKKTAMEAYWVPGVNHLGIYGRWAFAEFTDVYQIEGDFEKKVAGEFERMIESASAPGMRSPLATASGNVNMGRHD